MHYTAMAGLTLFPHAGATSSAPALSSDLLAIVVAVVAFLSLRHLPAVPGAGSHGREPQNGEPAVRGSTGDGLARRATLGGGIGRVAAPRDLGCGSYGPLGGAGAPPRRLARHLPVERDGSTHFVAVDDVVAIHANAHYTYIFDGTAKLFCPLAIGDVEAAPRPHRFIRVHRSHIVNIERVVGLKRAGDNGLVELAAPITIPCRSAAAGLAGSSPGSARSRSAAADTIVATISALSAAKFRVSQPDAIRASDTAFRASSAASCTRGCCCVRTQRADSRRLRHISCRSRADCRAGTAGRPGGCRDSRFIRLPSADVGQ